MMVLLQIDPLTIVSNKSLQLFFDLTCFKFLYLSLLRFRYRSQRHEIVYDHSRKVDFKVESKPRGIFQDNTNGYSLSLNFVLK